MQHSIRHTERHEHPLRPHLGAPLLFASVLILCASCGSEVTKYESLHLLIKSQVPASGSVTRLDIAILSAPDDDGKSALKYPPADGSLDELFKFPLPTGSDITGKGYRIEFKQPPGSAGPHLIRVLGQDDNLGILTAFSGVIDTSRQDLQEILLKAPDLSCDADGDGARDCSKTGCCAAGELGDCDDNAKTASPFNYEDPCTQCGNQIDEDCDGKDLVCVDTDNDKVPDCQELTCGAGAEKDPTVHPGAEELCDSKDNNCDGKTDEGLPYTDISGKAASKALGDSCGLGACAGGKVTCSGDGTGLVCDSAKNKAAKEDCNNNIDDDCNGKINDGCALKDIDGDGSNTADEEKACKFKHAKFHPEYHPNSPYENGRCCLAWTKAILAKHSDWKKTTAVGYGVPADSKVTDELLALCDFNCDNKIEPCADDDKDGDGVPAGLDCKDDDATVFGQFDGNPGAPDKCGDGIDQDCIGGDAKCTDDGDGDGFDKKFDCDDADKTVFPHAKEVCNGKDDDCDGIADNGNPEANDAVCGDPDGECGKQPGISVCKHWPTEQEPAALDCLAKALDADSRTCVGCEGDRRPVTDICDYLDNNCDGTSDEAYTYKEEKSGKALAINAACDGVGECGAGKVECTPGKDKATCDTDPTGSKKQNKLEVCDNKDNNCDGTTDENLTAIADASCSKLGACSGGSIQKLSTVCKAGKWVCDYAKIPNIEFDKAQPCTPGDAFCHCAGLGTACYKLHEATCDGVDNDCSGLVDEDFVYLDTEEGGKTVKKTYGTGNTSCGTGFCYGGKIVCTASKDGLTCDTIGKIDKEICDHKDNDCNGLTDDAMTVLDSNCKLAGVCNKDNVKAVCKIGKWECNYGNVTGHEGQAVKSCDFADKVCKFAGATEKSCDNKDNDCDGETDEDFKYTNIGDGGKATTLAKHAACSTGECAGGKVVCDKAGTNVTCDSIDKSSKEICDTKDNDCDGLTDEDYKYIEQGSKKSLGVNETCDGIGACGVGKVECIPGKTDAVTCNTDPNGSKAGTQKEVCDDADNDCNTQTDEGCDDDGDKYCDSAMFTPAKPATCPKGGGDCKDTDANFNPGIPEKCDGKDQDCNGQTDEVFFWTVPYDALLKKSDKIGIGKDCGLGACAGGKTECLGADKLRCTSYDPDFGGALGTKNVKETLCDDIDNDCDGLTDEGCDDDGDKFCDKGMTVIGTPKVCPKGGGDCNDTADLVGPTVFPGQVERCNDIDDDCGDGIDEGCDDDGDGWCDAGMLTIGNPKACPKGGGDCNDTKGVGAEIHPTHVEWCDDVDQNCNSKVDEGCDDDKDGYCDNALKYAAGDTAPKACSKGKGDCDDGRTGIHPGATETCNDEDEDCDSTTDEGCDDDGDKWCDAAMVLGVPKPKVCTNGGNDCNDKDQAVNPGIQEGCNTIDDDCDGKTDAADSDLEKVRPNCENQAGVCKSAKKPIQHCIGGTWKACSSADYQTHSSLYDDGDEKRCDDNDNDCDGKLDEGCDDDGDGWCDAAMLTPGKPKVCPNGGGDCHDSKQAANPYKTDGKNVHPGKKEDCGSDWDDNCNLDTNEKDATACTVFYKDVDGDGWAPSAANSACYCAKKDNIFLTALKIGDCNDGSTAKSSYSWTDAEGKTSDFGQKCGLGVCSGGSVECSGKFATCSKEGNKQSKELCDGDDNDCDGKVDESPDLSGHSCKSKGLCAGKGIEPECTKGKVVCNYSGVLGYEDKEETCDGDDNDCNGTADDGNLKMSSGACSIKGVCKDKTPVMKCISGAPVCTWSVGTYQTVENKCDDLDNDCDGAVDENPDLSALTCSNKGVCQGSSPTKKCTKGKAECDYGKLADYEKSETKCDNKDNDCDGKVDGMTDMLLSGPGNGSNACVQGVCTALNVSGECKAGAWTCDYTDAKAAGLYKEETATNAGVCDDKKDNDCNGIKDGAEAGCK